MQVALIGSNFITVSIALRLAELNVKVTIFEKSQSEWGGAWKLQDVFGWKQKELAWHVILFDNENLEYFEEYFEYFNFKFEIVDGSDTIINNYFVAPKYLYPEGGISSFIQNLNNRSRNHANISFKIGKNVNLIESSGSKIIVHTDQNTEFFDEIFFNSCVDLKYLLIDKEKFELPYNPRVATHIIIRFESLTAFSEISHLMHQDNLNSNYLFDLIGQLGLTAQSDEFKTLLVIRVKREFVSRLNENVELFMSTIESQIKHLLSFEKNSKITAYHIDLHRTVYRTDAEMSEFMLDIPKSIKWIPTQDLSRTIPFIMKNIW